jgi:hypothetical protein
MDSNENQDMKIAEIITMIVIISFCIFIFIKFVFF